MSLTSALSAAASGLGAVSRATELVTSNMSNATTDGYGRRELQLSSNAYSTGVRIEGVARLVSASVLGDVRLSAASTARATTLADWSKSIESAIGIAGDGTSLSDRVAGLESALASATAQPDSNLRLGNVLSAATDLATAINQIGTTAQDARQGAEDAIARDVDRLNAGLAEVARLNRTITAESAAGRDTSSLQDARQRTIDGIAEIIPLREAARGNGTVSLFTADGAALLDGWEPATITFTPNAQITPEMSVASGDLSYLIIDGRALTAGQMGLYAGGRLAANFEIRDNLAPAIQAQADQLAADLAARFAAGGPDASITTGAAGLFTDDGAALDTPAATGLAQRLGINAAVDPARGGALWHLRDGLYVATQGDSGDATLLNAMIGALKAPRGGATLISGNTARSAEGLAADLSSNASTTRLRDEATLTGQTARDQALRESLAADGVDTDAELQRLLALEQAYAANARVIRAVESMFDALLEI